MIVDLIAAERQTAETLQRGLIVVERVEVEHAAVRAERTVAAELACCRTDTRDLGAGRDRRRRTTGSNGTGSLTQRISRRRRQVTVEEILVVAAIGGHDAEVAERARAQLDAFTLVVVQVQRNVTAAFGDIGAQGQVGTVFLAIVVAGLRITALEFNAFKIVLQNKVDRARDGVRAIHCRGTAGDDVDPVKEGGRNAGHIDHAIDVVGRDPLTVDQDQVTLGPQSAQVDRRHARGAVVHIVPVAGLGDRQAADDLLDLSRLLQSDFLRADRRDRAGRGKARYGNPRAGDDDFVKLRLVLRSGLCHRRCGEGQGGEAADHRRRQQPNTGFLGSQGESPDVDSSRFRGVAALKWNSPFPRGQIPPPQLAQLCAA